MAISYSDFSKRENIIEPNFQRHRLSYKAPIPSSLLNLSNDQFLLDINRLKSKLELLDNQIETLSTMLGNNLYGATPDYYLNEDLKMTIYSQNIYYDEDDNEYIVEQSTPYFNESLRFEKFQKNSANVDWLMRKLSLIEGALQKDN